MATTARSQGFATDQRLKPVRKMDWPLLLAAVAILIVGLMSLYSLRVAGDTASFKKQLINLGLGLVPFSIFAFVDPRTWKRWGSLLYGFNVVLLLATLKLGHSTLGAQRWIDIGPIQFQPSELSKILLVLTLAAYFAGRIGEQNKLSTYILSLVHVAVPALLVFVQPHLGATLVLLVIWLAVSLAANVPLKFIFSSIAIVILAVVIAFKIPGVMHSYQVSRVVGMFEGASSKETDLGKLNRDFQDAQTDAQKKEIKREIKDAQDQRDRAYQTTRARIAFGVGGLFGTGYLRGEQKRGHFIPEQNTDFIVTVIGEEGGLVGTTLLLACFAFFFYRIWLVMFRATEPYYRMVAAGIFGMLAFHTVVNVGMVLQLLPVVGLWLPFMSYGGTALWLCMACVGLLLNMRSREKPVLF